MQRLLVLALALAVLLSLAWLLDPFGGAAEPAGLDGSVMEMDAGGSPAASEAELGAVSSAREGSRQRFAAGVGSESEDEAAAPDVSELPRARVFGTVVDGAGAPLGGVQVSLSRFETWSGAAGVVVDPQNGRYLGYFTETDAGGAFELDVAVPEESWTVFRLVPDGFHARLERLLSDGSDIWPVLGEGERDLGLLTLVGGAVVRGSVRSADGSPLEGAVVEVASEPWSTMDCRAETDASGRYEVGHVPSGSWGVKAEHATHHGRFVRGVEAVAGTTVEGPELVLEPGRAVRGVVLDEAGLGVAGARISMHQAEQGGGARTARADETGAFELFSLVPGVQRLSVRAEGFEEVGGAGQKDGPLGVPGGAPLEIVLVRAQRTSFVVVDAATGEPVEAFGLWIKRNNGRLAESPVFFSRDSLPRVQPHPAGRVEVAARPGVDAFELFAPGYRVLLEDVKWDAGVEGRQTVRLARGAGVRGRVAGEARPALGLERGLYREADRAPSVIRDEVEPEVLQELGDVFEPLVDAPVPVNLEADGSFSVSGLDPGSYRLFGRTLDGLVVDLPVLELGPDERRDLGELAPVAAGRVRGRLLLDPGVSGSGIEVVLGDWRGERTAIADAEGRFEIAGVEPGPQRLIATGRAGELGESEPRWVQVPAGGVANVELDLRGRATVRCELRFVRDGEPLVGVTVFMELEDEGGASRSERLGDTDADGRVGADLLPGNAGMRGQVRFMDGFSIHRPEAGRVRVEPGRDVRLEVAFDSGSVEVPWPEGREDLGDGRHLLQLFGSTDVPLVTLSAALQNGKVGLASGSLVLLDEPRRWLLEGVPVGSHRLSWEVSQQRAPVFTDERQVTVGE